MGTFSIWHWLILLVIVMLLFGGGRISGVMGDVAKGIKSFKKGLADDDETTAGKDPKSIEAGAGGGTGSADAVRKEKA